MTDLLKKLVFVCAAIFFGLTLWKNLAEKNDSKTWPFVVGHVTKSYVKEVTERRERTTSSIYESVKYYTLEVDYTYEVDGAIYEGSRLRVGGQRYSTEREAAQALDSYEKGTKVNVYYNPKMPFKSAFMRG
jgi:hypothetical protein